ncbi:MAG: UbiD family decarboxylase [Deltaproteobacteria bacterium]|nr:UbiD family decarboxylase [Deltaproteobacteria bacterium]
MSYKDVREWIQKVDEMGELKVIEGADWNLEIGALAVLASKHKEGSPALLFDRIKDYPPGYRILVGFFETLRRSALTSNLPTNISRDGFIQSWRERLATRPSIPPVTVSSGPILENVYEGDEIDLLKFPVPFWHRRDGGRYIGTGHIVITRDPEEGWVNTGCYRVMVHDRNTMGMSISPGKHGRMHRTKYFEMGKPCPVVACFGIDPLLHMIASRPEPYGQSELDSAGGIKGEPVEVIMGEYTGLPIPAHAEIAVEAEILPDQGKEEGPFSEWTGYYASGEKLEPLIKVRRLYHRNDPIITASPEYRPTGRAEQCYELIRAAYIRDQVEKAGVPDVKAVASYFRRFLTVLAIRQRYPGHARQAALIASQCQGGAYLGRYVVVVDDDIDAYDIHDVLWAMCTRADPVQAVEIIRRCWSGPLDPVIPKQSKGFSSRMIIDACRPFEWMKDFPPAAEITAEEKQALFAKWKKELFS